MILVDSHSCLVTENFVVFLRFWKVIDYQILFFEFFVIRSIEVSVLIYHVHFSTNYYNELSLVNTDFHAIICYLLDILHVIL